MSSGEVESRRRDLRSRGGTTGEVSGRTWTVPKDLRLPEVTFRPQDKKTGKGLIFEERI